MEPVERTSIWGLRTFVVITGASRGIGKTIALQFAQLVDANSTMLLLARSLPDLEETKAQIFRIQPVVDVQVQPIDLGKPDEKHYTEILVEAAKSNTFDLYLLVHNAGTTTVDTPAVELADVNRWNEYMTVNLYSTTTLTSVFLKVFKEGKHCIVNMSSLCAHKPFKSMAMYAVAKAARELFFRVLVLENPRINVLSYSPGPVVTDMYRTTFKSCFPDVAEIFMNRMKNNACVKVEDTVNKLVSILREQRYENGAFVDYLGLI